jgi:tRNA(Ile)-lysidine synthase
MSFIALGHTRTDRIETQVYRFFQGSAQGYAFAGIRARRGRILRPLLCADRNDVLAYLEQKGQSFCQDATNADTAFLRNHVRHTLIPAAEAVFPGFARAMDALAEKSLLMGDFVEQSLRGVTPWVRHELGWKCPFEAFIGIHPILRINSIYEILGQERIPYVFLKPLAGLTREKADGIILRGRGFELVRRGGTLFAFGDIVLKRKKGYFYRIDGNPDICIQGRWRAEAEEFYSQNGKPPMGEDVFFCGKDECLFLRSRRPGDVIHTGRGKKTLVRLFSDWKVREDLRDSVPLVQKNGKILAVLAGSFGGRPLRCCDDEMQEQAGRFFRIRIHKIGEESGQSEKSE